MASNRKFFRETAFIHYQQNRVPNILPKFASPFRIFLYWIFFLIFISIAFDAWMYGIPQFTQGPGAVENLTASSLRSYGIADSGPNTQATAIIFFAATFKTQIQTGSIAQVQIKGTQQSVAGTIKRIDEITLTLNEARQRYHLSNQTLSSIPQPALVALIVLDPTESSSGYNGKPVTARTQVAIQNVLSLFFNALTTSGAS